MLQTKMPYFLRGPTPRFFLPVIYTFSACKIFLYMRNYYKKFVILVKHVIFMHVLIRHTII
ncbi:hypothetical protein CRG95_08870 [Escherichia sp. E4208]|nr:hypothetical protein CRG95_08870 [Escherichia sp. E4208]TGC04226.1 hypothetical protein CRI63_08225 [Escherichia sp. E2661]